MTASTNYLAFDAYDIRDLLNQRLSEGGLFTDQLFTDSNISTLVDVFSYLYDILTYYVNKGASESIFINTTQYENINNIVKMLGYNPKGYIPSILDVVFTKDGSLTGTESIDIPRYTMFATGQTDEYGNEVYYSTVEDYLNVGFSEVGSAIESTNVKLYNGKWLKYTGENVTTSLSTASNGSFIAEGIPFEQFILTNIDSEDNDNPEYVGFPYIHIYVERDGEILQNEWEGISEGTLFGKGTTIYGPTDNIFEIRLNEDKKYVLKFGDGIHGQKLESGDILHVYYLRTFPDVTLSSEFFDGTSSSTSNGIISTSEIDTSSTSTTTWYDEFLGLNYSFSTDVDAIIGSSGSYYYYNELAASSSVEPEDVADIKTNAPDWFRTGGRLVTKEDFISFITSTFKNTVQSVKVMNNWDYLSSFMQWVYNINSTYLNKQRVSEEFYSYADSCDFNNVYIWIKYVNQPISKYTIESMLNTRKLITIEPIILEAFDTYFVPCLTNNSYSVDNWDPNYENYIEIRYDNNSNVSQDRVKSRVINEITNWFEPQFNELGSTIDISQLYNDLLAIDGVDSIYTVYTPYTDGAFDYDNSQYFKGLSFSNWTSSIVDGEDQSIFTGKIQLEDFQFPVLYDSTNLENRVRLVFESYQIPRVEY